MMVVHQFLIIERSDGNKWVKMRFIDDGFFERMSL
jgi:hypothetical protein